MPKQRITREMVVSAAFALARGGGMERVTVKAIAEKMDCSVQPIYSCFENMEALRRAVEARVGAFVRAYITSHLDREDPFRSTGQAFIRLTGEEPHLFRIFILHRREGIASLDDFYRAEADAQIPEFLAARLHLSTAQARQLHLDMLIYTVGLGAIFAVTAPGITAGEICAKQERMYQILVKDALEGRHEA